MQRFDQGHHALLSLFVDEFQTKRSRGNRGISLTEWLTSVFLKLVSQDSLDSVGEERSDTEVQQFLFTLVA